MVVKCLRSVCVSYHTNTGVSTPLLSSSDMSKNDEHRDARNGLVYNTVHGL